VCDVSQYVGTVACCSFFSRIVIHAMGKIGTRPQTLSCLAGSSLATGKLVFSCLACFLAERVSRADDDCPASSSGASTFVFSCRGVHSAFAMACSVVHLSPSYVAGGRGFSLKRGQCIQQQTPLLALAPHSGPVLPNYVHLPMRLLTLPDP